jgi:hypothetical protein
MKVGSCKSVLDALFDPTVDFWFNEFPTVEYIHG